MEPGVVLDAHALVAFLGGEAGGQAVRRALENAADGGRRLPISAVNWCEVVYSIRRLRSHEDTAGTVAALDALPIAVVGADRDMAAYAAVLKAEHRLGLGDSFAAALAMSLRLPLMTGDADFLPLMEAGLELAWLE